MATFLLADISGYTSFLHGVAEAHRAIIIEVDEPPPPTRCCRASSTRWSRTCRRGSGSPSSRAMRCSPSPTTRRRSAARPFIETLRACYAAFSELLGNANATWTCTCDACSRIHGLDLKFVLHHGTYVVQRIVGNEELAGPDVIVVHRLLKNHARDLVGDRPYALLSDASIAALDVPVDGMQAAVEQYEDMPPIPVHVLALA